MVELRVNIPEEIMAVIDAYSHATGKSRTDISIDVMRAWADKKIHESTIICRVAGVNPFALEKERKK